MQYSKSNCLVYLSFRMIYTYFELYFPDRFKSYF